MTQYIDKDDLVAEIERGIKEIEEIGTYLSPKGILTNLLCYINSLEVKEVDLEKEVKSQMDLLCNLLCYMEEISNGDSEGIYPLPEKVIEDLQRFAKHFFELGLRSFIWKPNDKQMKALSAMKRYCEIATSFNAFTQEIVESLYQDLNKLK